MARIVNCDMGRYDYYTVGWIELGSSSPLNGKNIVK